MHVMLDLETLGTAPGSAIIAIGAAAFDLYAPDGRGRGLETISLQPITLRSNLAVGLATDTPTLEWWARQEEAPRRVFEEATRGEGAHVVTALLDFSAWWAYVEGEAVWGNGSEFDVALLGAAYHACGLDVPWPYSAARCFRTIKKELGHLAPEPAFVGVRHYALNDAVHQARWLRHIMRAVRAATVPSGESLP